ncbi:TPA: hyperosmolarity resistance protein Ebh [Staphylococcus aureus]|nr:hyperosmolarity resistance protein Ebh [Staphylococcus aureus]HCV0297462.1 hyperosmolarity resistance protein Ebh [Staphylococcus aureus]HCV0357251.1 hyperosmolarity resistance protein Ebh [Staphylococcus aureus]HCV0605096.1 hyperosmolarity resistance protein Ebh [Staphylococcus aureus]HCV0834221.1 hyperosmolarity resistance protein Ebh [Staphylococcus aureus]
MNYRDKIQKFSIRKYTVGTFSTVIATLVFLGLNTSQAQAAETNQPASALKQKQQNGDTQTENREVEVQNSQNGQSLSAPIENEQPNNNQTNHVDASAVQSSTTEHDQPVSQNEQAKKDTAAATPTQSAKAASKHEQSESRAANKKENDNKATHVESHEANVVTASDSSDSGNVQHDRNELQAFFDANYHDYRFIDRENADSGTFNYVKGIFDKINTLLGSNDPINNKDLQLAYKELEQAVALIRTMPQRQQTSRRSSRIQTRSIESRAAEPRSVSDYQNANSSYYVENANDGSGYPVGTYINASSKGAPYNLPTTPWNTLKASDAKEIALITAKQTGDGYQWVIKFNKGHAPHENMIYWFALPAGQTPVGRTEFVTVNADGTNVQWSNGAGAGANKPLPEMWPYGVNDSRSWDYKIRNRSGQVIYDWPTVHINSLKDLARASDYFSEAGATPATKAFGRQTFEYINGERPTESPGVPKVYTFIGKGDASYTISFKTQGPTIDKLYYAAGGRALEYNQLFMYSQLYVESTQDYQQRLNGLRQVVNRTYRIGTTKRVEVSQGNVQTKKVLESTNLNIDDFMDDPLSYVKTPSNKVLGFYPTSANTNAFRPGGVNPLNEYQLSQLFTDDKLQQAARTGSPIRLMIGFDYPDAFGNGETLVPVNLTVLPEIQHNIKFFKNDDGQNIADKPASKQAGHPVFYVYAGNQGNASVNLGGSVTSIQPLRINLTSNENFTDKDWQITGIPRTLHIENSTNRTNNARERNIELVGNLLPGDYFGTIRFGRKEQLFEIRVKPHTPRITTTAEELRGTALQKVPVTVTDIPLDPSALVYLVIPTSQTRDGGSEADQIPSGYTKIATGTPDGVHSTITIRPEDYVVFIPPVGNQIRALIFYNNVVASNMSNAVTILPDDIPPTINNPVGLNAKYYRGDEVSFTMGVSDRHSGLKSTTITTLPSGWTSNLTKSDKKNGSLAISGRVSMNQAYNSDITFKVSATDNVNNTTNDSQSKHVTVHVGKISDDAHPIVLGNSEKVVVVNPTALTGDEKQRITTAFMNKNQNIRGYLASSNPVTVDNHGNVTLQYRDGSSTTLDATNVMTYEPVVKPEYQTANAAKTATVTIAKGQSFNIGDIKQYFTLSNGQAIPSSSFTNITSDRTIPTAQEVSQMNAGTQLYHIVATNAYHKDTEDFYITLKIIDVKQPEGDQRVYRMSTYDITTDEISKVKQAFINANRDAISFAEGDISVTNTPNGSNVSTITVNINKGRLTKSFTSNLNNMNFLRWVNFPQDYTVTWTNAKIANRPTDGGLSWSDDHKSLIYRYDATLGTQITTNDILTLLKATTTVPGLRNNIAGNEKAQAEAGGRPNYKTTGYSQSNPTSDGQRQFTLNGQVIQIMDIINPSNGFGGQPVTNSNVRANHSNSTVVSVNESAANGAGAFTIDHVVKNNSTHNAADAVYKAQLYLSPYGPKQYVEHLNQNTDNTNEAINIYFVPSDLVNPTISVGNYTNHQVFSGETFTNTITANDNFGVQSVTVPTTSQLTGTVDNNHQHVSATAPNVTSTTNKTINLVATDTSGNTATTSFNVTIKPLRDKYRVGTSSTAANPVRIANISNNATVSQADQTAIINSLTFTSNAPNRNYATASANEITSKTVSNVSRTGNNAQVTVTVTYQDGTTSTVTVPVKRVIPEIVAHSHYTVQGQDFPTGNGASASDYFKLSNGSAIPDATITWVSGQAPNKNNTTIGQDINVTAHILIDGETTPITKTATYKVVRTVPKQVFETARGVLYPGVSDMYDAKQYVKPVNNSWSTNAQHMNFQFTNSYGPSKDVVGISTRDIRVTYDNHQTQIIKILSKVKPDPPRIDGNSVTYKAGLTNQQIKINNVLSSSSIKLFKADNTPLTITNTTYGSGNTAVVTVSDALPNGEIKARSSISMNNVTYTTQDEHGRAIDVTRNESVDSNDSASVHVTPQLQATTEGAVFIKGGDGFDFGHVERFIQNPPHGATVAWHDNPDTWKNTVGNTHKTAVVTLPNGQGTRNVEVPVKVYPVANAKAPSRDVKGQNLTNGTDAINYITFDPNTNTNGITAVWANRQQPNNQQAGVQHLNVDVTYPGISAAKRVPVTVNVYQFEFPQTSYTTTVGGTLASGTQASGYAHIQNATGLPTDGFTYKWNNAATGTNDANWAAMNKPNTAQVINAKYDVIYNGHTFATSLPAKFVVKDVQPAKPTVTETAAGVITIAPGANQTVNTHAGNVTTYADKLVIKRNGNVVTTFTRHNNTSPWVKEASAANVAGIAGTNNGITVAAGTFNPADTIQAVATQGSGETISDEQRSDDFTVVAPQPNQATTKIWQNGHVDITPNNPSGHLINPTQAMDIAYTEKVGNGAEHSKTLNAVRGQNNQWTIANKPDYVTLDAHTGKVTFNANTIKPNSAITITPKAGTGHSASSNPSTLTAPAAHTVNTTEIVKDYGSNVTAAEINNAVQVANKRTATIKNGTAMPTNLAGGSTTTIPVTVTYNDSSTEEVQESIFTKADKRELITAKNHLDDPVSTDGKKPGTITQYNNAIHNAQQQINTAKTEAQQVINDERATPQQVNAALSKVQAAQTKINEAKALLQNKEDNSQLVTSKNNLQSSVNQVPSTTGMTQQSIDNYNAKKREAESEITAAQRVIDNGDATAQQISDEKHRVDNALTALNQAKQNLTADTHELEQAVHQLNRTGTTTGKKPASITAYNNSIRALQSDLTSAKNSANAIIQKPIRSVQEVQTALTNVNRVNDRLTLAINQLVPLADNSALRTAKTKLDEEINKSVTTDGMTQSSIQAYENAKRAGQTESTNAQNVINNGDATDQQIAAKKTKVEEKYNGLKQAIAGLTPDLAPLQAAKTQLQNDIDQPTSTTGMTSASVAAFNDKLSAARTKIQEIDRVLASHPDVATIRQNVTAANATKTALDQARNGLTVDKAPLENAKNQLQQSIDTQTSTTGMTQDSINAYNAKLTAARNKIQQINQVLAGSPTVDQINTNTSAANQAKSDLDHARQALTPDKAPLQTAKTQLEQSINQPTDTTGMTTASLNAYNQKLQAARQKLTEINQVLNGNPTVQNINDKVAEANQAKDQLNTARQGLTLDRQPAFTTLHGASNLNQAQQNNFTQQINAAPNHAALETIKSNITALNNAMTKLKDSVADNNSIKSGQNYTDATTANKQAYDNAVNAAKGVIGETTNPTMDVNTVNQKAETVKSTKGALDGQQNLQRAKTEATNAITHASDLNQTQKNALTQQVNNAQNVQAVNDIKQTTQSLNTAMTGLKRGVANHNQVVQSDNYVNADTNKKNDYNNAYNHANDIINGNAQHPVITPSDVNNALSNVTSKEQALNGEAKLNAAKQEANTALGQLNNLNNAQRQNLQSQINGAHQIETVNTIKQNATNLNSAMGNLRQAVADKEQVKRTEDYADADTAKQNAYNSAVSSAETIINQTTNPTMSVNDVNSATSAVTTNKNALNGDEKLAQSKTDAASAIDALPHLNNAQKADVKSKINAASNIAGVNTVKQQGTDLNTAMGNLQGAINDEQTTLNSQNYQDATPSKKTAYNNAVTAAENIINQANGTNANQSQVEAALSTVTTTKQALNGDRKVTDAKNNANQTLSTLDNLNNAQKGAVTGNINQAHTVAEVTQAIQTAQELNTAMGNLKNSLNDKDTTLGSQNFADADPEKKNAYNEAVRNAENILNKSTGTNVSKDQVEAAMNQVNTTKAALNGTQNLEKAKQHANTAIDGLSHLTNAQKEALKQLVQQSTTVAEAQGNEQKANNVDAAMDKLRQSIADNATTKQNQNYTDSSPNKKDAYNNAVTTAQGIIDQTTSPTLDPTVINQAAGQVSTTKNALNGNENLEAAKQQATQSLGSLDNLNNAQKQAVTDQINGAHTVDEANQIKQNAQNLNTAMGNLKQAIADKDATKATVNFTDADQAKQQAYNTAVTNAENIISKANGGNATQTEVEQAIQQVNAAKQALNGNANVQHAKDEATALINSSNDLNQAQKDALKQQVQNATTVAGVNNVKQTAQELNNAMTQLKQGIADKEQTKADGNFVNADPDKQNAYKQAVAKAEALISGTPDVVVTPSEITAALNKVTQAKNDLNGNTNLATTKQNVQHAIDQLPNLNQAQRDEYSKQITQATLVPNVNAIQQAATTLNDAMTQLKQGIANKAQIKGSENYHDADTDKQTAYDNAVTKAEELLKQTTNPTMDPNTIQQALTKVNDTNQALNGNQKLADAKQAAKTNLGTLDHLNDAQKQALTTQVEQAPDIATVNNVKQNAQNLNNAMTNLSNALQDKTETLNSINFTDADQAKKDAYTNAVAHAEGILSKANGSNASQTEVEQAMQRVNEAKQALNGNDNVQRAKDAAKQVITNANDLNQAQKDALKQQVDAAQTVANVNTIKQTAQDLNQAMTQLKQGIADKDQTKANGNFVNADTDKQNAYNNAVAHAEQIISGTPNANVDPQQVAQALQQVTQAKGDLNGNHNLQVAKDNANTAIDQLPNLNQTQKTALKDQVSHAELVTGVNAIKQNADALNNAMGTLKQQIQANSQVPQSVDFTQADQDKQQAYNNAANQAQQIANGTPTPVLTPDAVTQAVTTMNQAKDALNGDEKLAQAKQDAIANLDTLRDLNQPQRDALRNQINQAQALATVEQTKQNAQNVNTAMSNLKQGIANKDTVKASENYHDADADKQTAYTNAVSQAEGIINQTTNPMLNPDDITRALTQVTDAKNGLNGEAKLATEKQNAKDAVNAMTHLNDAQKQALKGQIDQSPEIAIVNQVKQTATSLDHAMDQLSQAINDKAQTLADGNYLNADPDKQNAYKQAVAKAEALLNKQSGTNEVQAQVESITNEVNAAKQALNGNDNLANAKQQAKQQLANLTHLNDAQKQSFESQITQAPLVTDVTTINQKAQALDHAMELLRNSVADNQATLASEDYHDATAQRQNDYNQAVTATNNIINQTTSPTMNPDEVNRATTQVNNTKVALDGDENLVAAKQQANNRLDQLDHLNNAQKQQLQSQITQSSDIAAVNGHKQTAESLNTAMGNLINAIADHQTVEQLGNFVNADTDKQTAYTTAVNEAEAMINKQTGQNANQTEVEQAITKVQTTLQALNGDHNLQVAKANATQAIDALTSLNDPQKTALKDQVTAATLVTAVHQIEQNANTLNQAMHGLRESIQDNAATKANSKYINEDQSEQQNYDQAVQAANNIINEQTATLDNNAINQAATTVNTTKAALHGDVKLQNDKDHAKQTVSQLTHLNNAQKHMEDTLIDSETTRTAVNHDLTEAQALDQLMDALQQSIADKDATRASSAYVNAEPNKKQSYDEAVQNAESIIAGLNNPTINKGNVTSATQAVTSSKNALDGVERLAQDKQTAGNSLNHLDQLTPAQQQALENQINNATTRDKVAEIIAQAQALNEAMKALKESIKDQPQTEASSKFINEDQAQKDAYTQAVQHAKDLINKTTDPTLAKSIIDQATQAVTDAKNNLHGDQKLDQDKQRATETLNNLSNLNTPQRQALENQINNAATRGEVAQKLTEAEALNQAMEALRNSIQDQQQTEAGSKFINEDKPQKDAYQAAVQNAKDLINQTNNPTLDKAQVEQLTQAVNQAKDNLHGDQKLADDKQHAVTDLNQLNGLNNPQRQALESQINNAATRDEVAQKLAEAKALDQAMQALRNSIQDQQQTESGSKFINEDKPQKDAYQAAVQNAKDLINQTGNPTLDKSQVEQLTQAVTTAKDNLHGDQKLARDQLQAVTTVNALPNLNHAQQQALTDAINAAPTRTEVAQHVQTATELDHAMETLKNKVDQVNTDKAQPNYTEASTDKKESVDQALQAAESITDPTNGSNANKDAVDQALTKLQEKVNELNGNERVAEAKTQAKQTIDQLTHLNADQIATAKQNIDQATKLQPIAELVDQATQLNQSMDQLQQAVNEHANVEQTVDYTQADLDKQNAYKQAIADAENVLKQNANKQQVDQALQNILNAKQALNGDERVALAKTNGKHDIEQLNALNNAQQDGFKGRIDQSNDLNQIQQIVDEAKALNRVMDQLSQGITGNEGRTKGSTNYVNADTQVKQVYDEAVDKAKQALDKSTGQNLTAEQVIKLNDAVTAAKKALNGEEKLNNRKSEALQRLDQLTHLNNAQRQLAIQQINNAETLNKASRAINRATKLDNAMGAVQQYIDEQHLGVISSTNYINADDNLKANYDNAIANAAHELDKVQGNAIAKAEAEQLKQNIIDAQNALNGDQNLANAKDKANAFVNSLNGLNQQQQHLAHNAINNADTVSDVTDIVNNQIDLNDAMETLKHLVDNEIPNAEQTVNYQNAEDNAKTNFDDAKRLANTLLNSDNTNVNDINGAIQTVNDAIQNLNGDQRLQDAKDKAIQSINQALANKLKEIEASNATDQDKLIAKNKAEELANSIINNINKATSNQDVSQVQTAGNHAIEQVHANEIPKAKIDANKDVDKQVQALIDEIDRNPILTDKEKQALKDRINQILQQGHNDINNAMTKEEIEQAKAQLGQALQDIKDLVKAKESAKQDIDKQVQALIDEIDRNPILTDKEKQALKDRINQILQQGHNGINNAMTKEEIEHAKAQLAQALQDIKDLVKAKEDAKNAIKALANAKRDQINSNPDLTLEQKAKALKEIDEAEKRALENIENAQTKDQLNQGLNLGLDDIRNTHVWEVDAQPAVNEIFDATPEQILVNGELIVHRDDIITEQDILAHINLIDQLTAEIIDTPSTATISDSLTAKVEVTLLDGSKVIVNVPVKVVEKELTVVKQQAIESIENAAQQKINEINNHATLTPEQKEAAIAEVNKLKQQAIEQINNAADVHTVEEVQHQEQAHIEQFNPDQFTIDQAKSNAIKSISDAIQHMIDEINASKDLTDKEKQEAISKLNQLKDQSIQAIQRAQSIDEIAQQLEQFKAQLKAANPFAKELENRKKAAISKIKDISTDKIDRIRNSTIGTAEERQAAMNRINEIVLETIKDINNAQTPQQVEAALNNGIARILAVQIVTSDHSKPSSNSDGQSNSHLHVGYGTVNHPFNSSPIGHKKKLDQDDEIDPLHMRHFGDRIGNVIKNALGVVGISGLLASFWFFIAKRRRKEDEEEELEIRDNSKDKKKGSIEGTKHLPLLFAKRRRKEDEEDAIVEEKDSLNNDESLDKVKHTPFFLPKRRRKEDEEDVEVTNENTDEKVLQDNEHSPVLIAKRLKDKDGNVETTTSIESKDEDVPLLLAKKKNQKDNQSKGKKSASKKPSKKVAAKKKKKKSKKNKK